VPETRPAKKSRIGIVALAQRAGALRRIADDLGFKYTESAVPDEPESIRFTFVLTEEESTRLLRLVPHDVYARRAYLR
jgi:hypothetical protein